MAKKNERLCWNCDAIVNILLNQCPYCGSDLTAQDKQQQTPFSMQEPIPEPPYTRLNPTTPEPTLTQEEWNRAIKEEEGQEEAYRSTKGDLLSLLLLLPGIVLFLFGCALFLFSHDGVLTLQWDQEMAYFYFLGAAPLLFFGWRHLR